MVDESLEEATIIKQLSSHPTATNQEVTNEIIAQSLSSLLGFSFFLKKGSKITLGESPSA